MADQDNTGTAPEDAFSPPTPRENLAPLESKPPTGLAPLPRKPLTIEPPAAGGIGANIADILKSAKLPERQELPSAQKKAIENKAAVFDTTLGQVSGANPKEEPISVPEIPKVPRPERGLVVPVHTLKDDLQSVVREDDVSVIRAVALEQDRRAHEKNPDFAPPQKPRSKRTGIVFTIVPLILLGSGALFGVYIFMQSREASGIVPIASSLLFAESSASFPLENQAPGDVKQKLASARAGLQGTLGSIIAVVPTLTAQAPDGTASTRAATLPEFFQAVGAHPPDSLVRALDARFFFGFHIVDTNAPVFVIPVLSYDRAFAGMLEWEGTVNADLSPVFQPVPATIIAAGGLPVNRMFADNVMRNYDVRELKDDTGKVVLYYSFPSQRILIIAESPYSFAEILSRLQASRQL